MAGIVAKVVGIEALGNEDGIFKITDKYLLPKVSERQLPIVAANALGFYMGIILCLRSLYRLTSLPTKSIMPDFFNIPHFLNNLFIFGFIMVTIR